MVEAVQIRCLARRCRIRSPSQATASTLSNTESRLLCAGAACTEDQGVAVRDEVGVS